MSARFRIALIIAVLLAGLASVPRVYAGPCAGDWEGGMNECRYRRPPVKPVRVEPPHTDLDPAVPLFFPLLSQR